MLDLLFCCGRDHSGKDRSGLGCDSGRTKVFPSSDLVVHADELDRVDQEAVTSSVLDYWVQNFLPSPRTEV